MLFEELSPKELNNLIKNSGIVYLPLGTLEWHQHHLPFGVDAIISYELCKQACTKTGGCILPPIYFGTDREHDINGNIFHGMDVRAGRILPGSIYFLKEDFFYSYLLQIVHNIADQGFKKLIIISAHSGTAQQRTLEKVVKEYNGGLKILIFPGKQFPGGGIDHAGKIETSLMLAIRPDLVDISQLEKQIKPYEALSGDDPLDASEEAGKEQIEQIVQQVIKVVEDVGYQR